MTGDRELIELKDAIAGWTATNSLTPHHSVLQAGNRLFVAAERQADRLEARLDEVERYRAALGRIAQRDIAGLAEYTPQAMVAIASQALKGANNG